jgi:hypothetical protein
VVPFDSSNGAMGGPLPRSTFRGVDVQLRPRVLANSSAGNVYGLEIVGEEPSGAAPAWVILENQGPSIGTWNRRVPDGAIGVSWASQAPDSIVADLRVADTDQSYIISTLGMTPAHTTSYCVGNVRFDLSVIGYGGPGGDGLEAAVSVANRTTSHLEDWTGLLLGCDVGFPGIFPNWTCPESFRPDHAVGLVWNSQFSATVMVSVERPR